MKKMKITVVGNSIALRIRPKIAGGKNYASYLQEVLIENYPNQDISLNNTAFSRATVYDIHKVLNTEITNQSSDLFLINLGVCDASTREIPYWFAEILNNKKESIIKKLFAGLHHLVFKKNRAFFVRLRGKRPWISVDNFDKGYRRIIDEIRAHSKAPIICLPINPPDDRVESILPGSAENYIKYNLRIAAICRDYSLTLINLDHLNSKDHFPDGAHYSDLGHRLVCNAILEKLEL